MQIGDVSSIPYIDRLFDKIGKRPETKGSILQITFPIDRFLFLCSFVRGGCLCFCRSVLLLEWTDEATFRVSFLYTQHLLNLPYLAEPPHNQSDEKGTPRKKSTSGDKHQQESKVVIVMYRVERRLLDRFSDIS